MNRELKKVGLLGGTFDPIHNGHLDLAARSAKLFDLQEVLFIPVSQSPHKLDSLPASSTHRVAMLDLALKKESLFSIELLEVDSGGVSYSIDTLSQLKDRHPEWEFFMILGADAFLLMDTWKRVSEILKLCHILVSTRPGIKLEFSLKFIETLGLNKTLLESNDFNSPKIVRDSSGKTIQLYEIPTQNISSTEIRQKVRTGKEIKNLLPPSVDHYIIKNRLYRDDSPPKVA